VGSARYTAFLSYSHRDAAQARWLHRRLESYRIPRRLVGTEGERGPVPARLSPIFRDREELPAAGDLSEKVREALAASDNLIILCSPSSAASLWVAKEIAVFRQMHPGRPILAAIVDGEPGQCFPAPLSAGGVEPLAADLRPGRDGRRLGLLKLVAGLAGVGLDQLAQRDSQRRLRRVTWITAAALGAMLVMMVLTAIALSSRGEAQRQRVEAEGLVEFMLTDLRTKLKGIGSIDTMQTVNQRALQYYGGDEALGGLNSESLIRRARILRAIGEDLLTAGDTDAALLGFREAHRVTGEQLARWPNDPKLQLEHGRSEFWIGRVHELRHEWPAALRHYLNFASATDRLLAKQPNNPEYLMAAASAAIDIGNFHLSGTRDFAAAERHYQQAIQWSKLAARMKPADPGPLTRLADAYAYLADTFYMREMWRQSLAARLNQHRIRERMHRAEPANLDFAYKHALAKRAVAASFIKVGDTASAAPPLFEAYHWANRLVARDPKNGEWQLLKGAVGCELLFRKVGLPDGILRSQVEAGVRDAGARLNAQRNPRAAELQRCLHSLQ
jgi:hypothetical protein